MTVDFGFTGGVIFDVPSGVAVWAELEPLPAAGTLGSLKVRRGSTAGGTQPRIALYKGGVTGDPSSSTLVHDFGQLTGSTPGALETYTASGEALALGDRLWVDMKFGSSATSIGASTVQGAGDFLAQDVGSFLNGQISADPTVPFPSSPGGFNGIDQGTFTPCVYITYTLAATTSQVSENSFRRIIIPLLSF